MVGLIHRGWLAGVSLGPKSNQEKNSLKKNKNMIRMVYFIQKTEDFSFSSLGGVRVEILAVSQTF